MIFSRAASGTEVPAVREFLQTGASGARVPPKRFGRRELELIFQAFCVLVRRRLARATRPLEDQVRAAFPSLDPSQVDKAVDLVRLGLGRDEGLERVRRDAKLLRLLTIDLVLGQDVNEVMATAQAYAARHNPSVGSVPRATNVPRSIVGRSLNAIARYDRDELDRLPEDPSDQGVHRVSQLALESALSDYSPDSFQIGQLARNVARLARKSTITAEAAEAAIHGRFDLDSAVLLEAKVLVFARIVEDLGMYESELNALIRKAEDMAQAEGIELTLMAPIA